jgi:AhpC/TSA family/Disulphide bond corrector protein DsbC
VELEQQVKAYAARGVQVAAITYDSPGVLKSFAGRRAISYPLLSDEGSRTIKAFGILNGNIATDNPAYGVPFPVTYLLDAKGRVKRKYFEEDYRERYSAANILVREFNDGVVAGQEIQAKHLKLRTSASNASVYVGSRVMLVLEVTLPPKMHVYAPGVQGYKPIEWTMAESKGWIVTGPEFPPAKRLHLKAIGETVPVYERTVKIRRDLVAGQNAELRPAISADGNVTVDGVFRYQACDDKVCYVPEQVPLKWVFPVEPLDSVRVPAELRKTVQ